MILMIEIGFKNMIVPTVFQKFHQAHKPKKYDIEAFFHIDDKNEYKCFYNYYFHCNLSTYTSELKKLSPMLISIACCNKKQLALQK